MTKSKAPRSNPQHLADQAPHSQPLMPSPDCVCAVIVAYFPAHDLIERVQTITAQTAHLLIVDNTPENAVGFEWLITLAEMPAVTLIRNAHNTGVAYALNQGIRFATKAGYQWFLTLDQDSVCFPDLTKTLLAVARATDPLVPIIGGKYIDPRNDQSAAPVGKDNSFLEQVTVITSGCLIDTRFASDAGGFREDFFIDQVDHEFCLRARALGKKVVISKKPVMLHSVGEPDGVRLPWLGVMPNHSPLRKYYIARNTVVTIANYWRREPAWCLRRALRLILGLAFMGVMESQRLSKVHAFMCGIVDGLSGRMGPCQRKAILASTTDAARTSLLVRKASHDS